MINGKILVIILMLSLSLLFIIINNFFNKIEKFTSNSVYVQPGSGLTGKYGKTCTECISHCADGEFLDGCGILASGTCSACPIGNCADGEYLLGCSGTSSGSCAECPISNCEDGEYLLGCSGLSSGTCTTCADVNKVSIDGGIGEESCVAKEGYYTETDGTATECPINTYKNAIGDAITGCTECPDHTQSEIGSTSLDDCINCPLGHGQDGANGARCQVCYQGQDSLEGQGCTPCPGDQVSWNGGRCVEPESSERACGVAQRVWETGSCVDHWSNWVAVMCSRLSMVKRIYIWDICIGQEEGIFGVTAVK